VRARRRRERHSIELLVDFVLDAPAMEDWIDCSPPHLAASNAAHAVKTTVMARTIEVIDSSRVLNVASVSMAESAA
jgi:hypothetical protein